MEQLTLADAASLLKTASAELQQVGAHVQQLEADNADLSRYKRCTKIASSLSVEQREGLGEVDYAEKLASSEHNLDVFEQALQLNPTAAMKLASPSDSFGSTELEEDDGEYGMGKTAAAKQLNNWLLNDGGDFGGRF